MIILDGIEQNSPEWYQSRLGIPTASSFDKIITSTGTVSTQRTKYMYQLAGERIIGQASESYINFHMERGTELEPEARDLFQMITGREVKQVGFCYHDEKRQSGCSPDGIIDDEELLEIKCPSLPVHVEYLIKGKLPTAYRVQIMGSLFVTGLERANFFSYYPGIKPFWCVVERDEMWIARFSKILNDFLAELEETYEQLMKA